MQQRKRRARVGTDPSIGTKDRTGPSNLEPAEDVLPDSPDGGRTTGERLMECVVKVLAYTSVCHNLHTGSSKDVQM